MNREKQSGGIGILAALAVVMIGAVAAGGLSASGLLQPKIPSPVQQTLAITSIDAKVLEQGNLNGPFLMIVQQGTDTFYYAKVINATLNEDAFVGNAQLSYITGETGLITSTQTQIDGFKARKESINGVSIFTRMATGFVLSDGSILPVKVISGRVSKGHLVGDFRLLSLRDQLEITGTFDSRGALSNLKVAKTVRNINPAVDLILRETLKLYAEEAGQNSAKVLGLSGDATGGQTLSSGLSVPGTQVQALLIVNHDTDAGSLNVQSQVPNVGSVSGPAGPVGLAGSPGLAGAQGLQGNPGNNGPKGDTGAKGDTGETGTSVSLTTSGTSSNTSSNSGLEVTASGLAMLRGCSNGQILAWNSGTSVWECSADSSGGSPTFDGISTGTNTTATMTVGTGGTLTFSGSGVVNASTLLGSTWASPGTIGSTTPAAGTFTTLTGNTSITSSGLLMASNGLTQTTGALSLTATSGSLTLSGLGASSISTGANALTVTSSNFNTTATGINSTAIGATTPSTAVFTTLTLDSLTRGGDTITDFTGNGLEMSSGALQLATTTGGAGLIYTSGVLAVGAGNGVTVNANDITVDLTATTDALSSTTSSGSGLEVLVSGLTMLQGCSDTQILKWNETTDVWECAADSSGGSPSFDTIATGTNTTATMTVGTGGTLTFSGSGVLNASTLGGATFASPTSIGSGVADTGAFTTLSASSTLTASNGLTMTTGALNLTSTSGAISSTGLTALTQTLSSGTAAISAPTLNLNVAGTGNTVIGNATGTLALTGGATWSVATTGVTSGLSISGATNTLSNIGNASLTNSSVTVTAGSGLTDGGSVSLGGTTTLNIGAGSGITVNANDVTIDLTAATDGLSSTTSSGSGLEVLASGLTMLQGCSDTQILKWNETTDVWECSADSSGGSPTFDGISTGTNTTATMTVGTGGTLTFSGSGVVNASTLLGATWVAPGTIGSTTPNTGAFTTLSSSGLTSLGTTGASNVNIATAGTGNTAVGNATGTFALTSNGGLNVTTGGALTGVASVDTISVSATGLTFAGAGTIASTTTSAMTVDSGSTGAVNIGTGANAKTVTLGTTDTTSTTNIQSGTGGILMTAGVSGSSSQVRIGNSASATPDLLVLDNGTADPTGVNGGMYYNTTTGKFRCFENSSWGNCGINKITQSYDAYSFNQATSATTAMNALIATGNTAVSVNLGANEFKVQTSGSFIGCTIQNSAAVTVGSYSVHFRKNGADVSATNYCTLDTTNTRSNSSTVASGTETFSAGDTIGVALVSSLLVPTSLDTTVTFTVQFDSGADLAETYFTHDDSIVPGDVVSIDTAIYAGAMKSTGVGDRTVLGVVSTQPGMTLGQGSGPARGIPVALSGRVPVKVSTEGGAIKAGDYLTTSSTPGVAMKAVKAGVAIGMAMDDYSGMGIGTVTVFVKNTFSTGARLAGVMKGIDVGNSAEVLASLLQEENQFAISSDNASEIFTDLLTASNGIITPTVTARDINITGILTADVIRANRIEGMEIYTNKLAHLDSQVASVSGAIQQSNQPISSNLIAGLVSDLFKRMVEFFGNVIFHGDIAVLGRPTFNKDTAGYAVIKSGSSTVDVKFDKTYADIPVVTSSLIVDAQGVSLPGYYISQVTKDGFKIVTNASLVNDLKFSWMAISVDGMITSVTPEEPATPTPTIEISPSPEASPSAN